MIDCRQGYHECDGACASNTDIRSCGRSCSLCLAPTGGEVACEGPDEERQCAPSCPDPERPRACGEFDCVADEASCEEATRRIVGQVRAYDDTSNSDVRVCLLGTETCANSGVNGQLSLEGLPTGRKLLLSFAKAGHFTALRMIGAGTSDATDSFGFQVLATDAIATGFLQLAGLQPNPERGHLLLRVRDAETGGGLSGARVSLERLGGGLLAYAGPMFAPLPVSDDSQTTASGGVWVGNMLPGIYDVTVTHELYRCDAPDLSNWGSVEETYAFQIQPNHQPTLIVRCRR